MSSSQQEQGKLAWLIVEDTPGTLLTRAGDRLPIRIAHRDEHSIWLILIVKPGEELSRSQREPLLLEYIGVHGLASVRGHAELEDNDVVRFTPVEPITIVQRREFVRIRSRQRVTITTPATDEMLSTWTTDISGGGMMVRESATLAPEQEVHFCVHLAPDEPPLEGDGRVVRSAGDDERAIAFERVAPRDLERLIRFVFDR
jgi:hypothetical protein